MALRSEESRQAILNATMRLLADGEGGGLSVQQLSIERIAREAGVSKTTIYRWWPNKAAVVIDTFLENHILATPEREDLPALDALREHLKSLAGLYSGHEGRLMAQLIAESQYDAGTLKEFKDRFWRPRRVVTNRIIQRAMDEGSIRSDFTTDEIANRTYSPIYFALLFQEGSLSPEAVESHFRLVLEGAMPNP